MRQKKKTLARKPAPQTDPETSHRSKRRNSWEPQIIVPHQVDLPLDQRRDEVAVPAAVHGRSLSNGRL